MIPFSGIESEIGQVRSKTEELRREIMALDDQKAVFEKVIRFYDRGFALVAPSKVRSVSLTGDARRARHKASQPQVQPP